MLFNTHKTFYKITAGMLLFAFLNELLLPTVAMALTGGPGQPEFQRFTPASAGNMVNVFTGDFNYNIPLFDVGGYPLNLAYDSDVRMDEEASWVGLGWNLNIGSITRQVRGLPDDFNGDQVEKHLHTLPNRTFGMSASVPLKGEVIGFPIDAGLSIGSGIYYNNYKGINFEQSLSSTVGIAGKNSTALTAGLGLTASSEGGLDITPGVGLGVAAAQSQKNAERGIAAGISGSISFNSREGLKALQLGTGFNAGRHSLGVNWNHSFAEPTYTPSINHPTQNTSYTLGAKIGGEAFGLTGWVDVSGYYSEQRISPETVTSPAYGYYYSHIGTGNNILLDYNREKDGVFSVKKPAIAPAYFTPDAFTVNAQGISGGFKVNRGDIGYVFDKSTVSYTDGSSLGLEVGAGNVVHPGVDLTVVTGESKSELWSSFNNVSPYLTHRGTDNSLYEPAFFKFTSDLSILKNKGLYNTIGDIKASRFPLGTSGNKFDFPLTASLESYYPTKPFSSVVNLSSQLYRPNREPRQNAISALTISHAKTMGLQTSLYSGSSGPVHHFGEFSITNEEGKRFVFGLPAFNTTQKDVAFAVAGQGNNYANHLVSYTPNDNSDVNNQGIDNLYSYTKLPPYAHSHLLTAVLSPDYEDKTQDGPTDDDLGDYVKFNYFRHLGNYKWRMPFEENNAMYNAGLSSDVKDDQGSYSYGEKELWYPNSIESRGFIAVFTYDNREDGYGVKGENGGLGTQTQKLLKKVTLYGRPDYLKNGSSATPLKEAEFEYDYSLCPNVPNHGGSTTNGTGKLTLKKVFITSGKSQRGKLNPYQFTYSTNNPSYNSREYDRWGYYKPQGTLANSEFPYAEQNPSTANSNSTAWKMTEITLPSGGKINIEYESDDYAYNQDKQAMEMFKVDGVNSNSDYSTKKTELWTGIHSSPNLYLFFPLKNPVGTDNISNYQFRRDYFALLNPSQFEQMFFKFKVRIGVADPEDYEYVQGYAQIDDVGLADTSGGYYHHGFIKLKSVNIGDKDWTENVNPISKAAWQMGRIYLPRKVWDLQQDPVLSLSNVKGIATTLLQSNFATQLAQTIAGPNRTIAMKGYGKDIDATRCWIRLYNPIKKKFGGGSRVKRILMNDQWSVLSNTSGAINQQTGFIYDYSTIENGTTISSGVASYEPMIGSEENPQHLPLFWEQKNLLVPDERFYVEEPLGEMVFPSPSVGYSKVTITPLHTAAPATHRSGKVVHEFYTAKDFPVYTYRTPITTKRGKTALSVLVNMFGIGKLKDYLTVTQGFSVEINDMHGKEKAVWNYAEGQDSPVSGQEYFYHTDPLDSKRLENTISVIDKSGQVKQEPYGLEFMACADFRESSTSINEAGGQINADASIWGIIPLIIPAIWPQINGNVKVFRSSGFTKVISRSGILKSVVNHDLSATVPTVNVLYELLTGEPVLTATINEFKDTVYSLKYPAYWAYENMGMAAANQSYVRSGSLTFSSGNASVTSGIFRQGDEIILKGSSTIKAWVLQANGSNIYAITQSGQAVTGTYTECMIYRSGRKNLLAADAMGLTSLVHPARNGTIAGLDSTYKVLDISASEFSQHWQLACGGDTSCSQKPGSVVNPFLTGVLGHWRQNRNWAFVTPRDSTHIRYAGTYQSFSPMFKPNGGNDFLVDSANWVWSATTTKFLPSGTAVEERDALGRFTSQIYGFCGEKVTAQVANARYANIAYESFEDDIFPCNGCTGGGAGNPCVKCDTASFCSNRQMYLLTGVENCITDVQAHTGSYSLGIRITNSSAIKAQIIAPTLFENNCYPHTKSNSTTLPYSVDTCDCLGHFSPQSRFPDPCNKHKYVFSCWFKRTKGFVPFPNRKVTSYSLNEVATLYLGSTVLIPTDTILSPIIDTWQQLNYIFEIPGNCSGNQPTFKAEFKIPNSGFDSTLLFIDDIRIHPFESNMKSFVYDWKNLRHIATLDENNFASLYQYDREGNLISVKKETERGIVTVSEYKQVLKSK